MQILHLINDQQLWSDTQGSTGSEERLAIFVLVHREDNSRTYRMRPTQAVSGVDVRYPAILPYGIVLDSHGRVNMAPSPPPWVGGGDPVPHPAALTAPEILLLRPRGPTKMAANANLPVRNGNNDPFPPSLAKVLTSPRRMLRTCMRQPP
ncbi:Hypothetical predicted protein [Pelobates cultripes]|uniref:Uncharacterized protein n=1 Tax=Pelobates cultripes TaxID=61616 RepID=A0AAD1T4I6_PELCU|nr:Hypothetical predicted protein [Pelobates cultripes]